MWKTWLLAAAAILPWSRGEALAKGDSVVVFWAAPGAGAIGEQVREHARGAARSAAVAFLDVSPRRSLETKTSQMVAAAISSYNDMQFMQAIAALDEAATSARRTGAAAMTRGELVDLFVYRALAKVQTEDDRGAWSDFVHAATLDPTRILDAAQYPPKAIRAFGRAVESVSQIARAELSVVAPQGSEITIDGIPMNRHEVDEYVYLGEHFVHVRRPMAPAFARSVTISGKTVIEVPAERLRPPDGQEALGFARLSGATTAVIVSARFIGGQWMVYVTRASAEGTALVEVIAIGDAGAELGLRLRSSLTAATRTAAPSRAIELDSPAPRRAKRARWYNNRWLWLGVGAALGVTVTVPFLIDRDDPRPTDAALDPGPLQ